MRITPVTGDLPAVATPPPPPVRHLAGPSPEPVTAPVASTGAAGTSADASADARPDHRRPPDLKPFFDPPLIAQRAALGLPTGYLTAEYARSEHISYAAAAAAVDRELSQGD